MKNDFTHLLQQYNTGKKDSRVRFDISNGSTHLKVGARLQRVPEIVANPR